MTRGILGLLLVAGALAVAPASALADISSVNVTVTPTTTAAGAHPDVTVNEAFTFSRKDNFVY